MNGAKLDSNAWVFRVASVPEAGAGHMSRCIHLARAFSSSHKIHFVLDQPDEVWRRRLGSYGFSCSAKGNVEIKDMLGCVLDGYQFTEKERGYWQQRASTFVEFDDHADVSFMDGFQYALIDPEYFSKSSSIVHPDVKQILVTFGCLDKNNLTDIAINALNKLLSQSQIIAKITVAISSRSPHFKEIKSKLDQLHHHFHLLVDADDLKAPVFEADLIIGAGGMNLLERMAAGTPSIVVIASDNQRTRVRQAEAASAVINLGETSVLSVEKLSMAILELSNSFELRRKLSQRSRELVDGKGAERLVDFIRYNKNKVICL